MKKLATLFPLLLLILFTVQSCDFLGGVFKTGVGVGVFAGIIIIVLIVFIVRSLKGRG